MKNNNQQISYEDLTNNEKVVLDFFISNLTRQRDVVIHQLERSKIIRDCSPYFYIIRFSFDDISNLVFLNKDFNPFSCIQILHRNGNAPTVFTLNVKEGRIAFFEIYNADSSPLDLDKDKLCDGDLFLEL